MYGETLVQPITAETIKDLNQLNEKRRKLLEEAEYTVKTQAKLDQQLAEVKKTMEEANNLKTEYKRMIAAKDVAHDVAKNDPALRRRMDFASAKKPDSRPIVIQGAYKDSKGRQVFSTPIDNFAMAREILKVD